MNLGGDGELLVGGCGSRVARSRQDCDPELRAWGTRAHAGRVGPRILDASVLIGLLARADAPLGIAVDDVEAGDQTRRPLHTPASVDSEALVACARADRVKDARAAIACIGFTVTPLTAQIAERAAGLRAGHGLRLSGALVLATVRERGADLLTYDDRLSRADTRT